MSSARIFTPDPPSTGPVWLLGMSFALVVAAACAVEAGDGDILLVLFGLPSLVFGFLSRQWWAVAVPIMLTTIAFAAGVECSVSDSPQALLLAGVALGVLTRRTGDRLVGRR